MEFLYNILRLSNTYVGNEETFEKHFILMHYSCLSIETIDIFLNIKRSFM